MTISATTRGLRPGVCTSSTRPSSPFDGQLIYETDTNRVAVYDTNAWVYKTPASTTGSVLQVVSTAKTNVFTTTSNSFVDITGLSATITPSSSSNKVLIIAHLSISGGAANTSQGFIRLAGGNAGNYIGDTNGSKVRATFGGYTGSGGDSHDRELWGFSVVYLDSPATTSATTYKVQGQGSGTSSGTLSINEARGVVNDGNSAVGASSITVMEIAG